MCGKNIKYILVVVVLLALGFGVGRLSAAGAAAPGGNLDSPGPPKSTFSYTLEDIYNRLNDGTEGAQSVFTEPAAEPTVGTGHTLNEIMATAPAVDDTNGATQTHVLAGKTFWGLSSGQWGVITGTTPAAPVPRTGQTISYAPRDDGDLQEGVAWPNPRFTDNGDGTVTDNLTGLIWLKNANCFGRRIWTQALSDANTLNSGECDLSDGSSEGDWRLPNLQELQSLLHYGVDDPAVPNTTGTGKWTSGDPFTGVQSRTYWSSTTQVLQAGLAWDMDMDEGFVFMSEKLQAVRCVWPVRGGQ